MKSFKTFITLQPVLSLKCTHTARKILVKNDRNITKLGDEILGRITYQTQPPEKPIELAKVSLGELGLLTLAKYSEVMAKANECGLRKCDGIIGPLLRIAYADQPFHEELLLGMDTEQSSDNIASVFSVSHFPQSGLCLDGCEVLYKRFPRDRLFVFMQP